MSDGLGKSTIAEDVATPRSRFPAEFFFAAPTPISRLIANAPITK